ncbi:TetR/AcrR family transcriptional regulator [Actinomadura livida]|uniref:AcrR family transcriptional regulator n=1 Tax=Actinomadura livida TaxID=79909 RepID=A0A7W7I9I0_9ACTN|nr:MULTISPECIES: TetR/AcrR family transcriptional regulator [Actinomadura]MBB4772890.1 AcrR family transcriptional regulator [Actinomadura catellatispora]GGU13455.1 TetR family transcriptional regulator [Actinomadura livida]
MSPRKAAALRAGDRTLREHLIVTAERMISERGTAGLTVRAIAREAGVADGVLYNHFADKEELLAQALRARVEAIGRTLPPLPEPGDATVEANLRVYVEHGLLLHDGLLPALAGLLAQPRVLDRFTALNGGGGDWRDRLARYLRGERDLGRIAAGARVEAATSMIVGVCHEAVLSVLLQGEGTAPRTSPEKVDDLVATVLEGIGPR